jgi:K+-transporting ATPase KdpF subunit
MKSISSILVIAKDAVKSTSPVEMNSLVWYIIGAAIGFLLLGYLTYVLLKPEKF